MLYVVFLMVVLLLVTPEIALVAPFAYVADNKSNTLSVIDVATDTVVNDIPVSGRPFEVVFAPNGQGYVANYRGNNVAVIDLASHTVVATIPVGRHPEGMAITRDGTRVYVANSRDNTVSVINTATKIVSATIPVGIDPDGIAIAPDGKEICLDHCVGHVWPLGRTAEHFSIAFVAPCMIGARFQHISHVCHRWRGDT